MIPALDVQYDEDTLVGVGAAVVFERWEDELAVTEFFVECKEVAAYTPGEFYKRELPCLLAVLQVVVERLSVVIVDGYVGLDEKPGLGWRLWEALGKTTPVVGVAKTRFRGVRATEVLRGRSRTPLYVTAVGISAAEAAANVMRMAGPFRVPAILKRVDRLARDGLQRVRSRSENGRSTSRSAAPGCEWSSRRSCRR